MKRAYCKHCGYSLRGIDSNDCPECGESFDLDNPSTYLSFAIKELPVDIWLTLGLQATVFVLVVVGVLVTLFDIDIGFLGYYDGSYPCFTLVTQIAAMFCGAASIGLHYKKTVPGYRRRLIAVAAVPWVVAVIAVLSIVLLEMFI